jgi:hypothetical protein
MLWHFTHTLVAFLIENYKVVGAVSVGILAVYKGWQSGILHPLVDLKVAGKLIRDGDRQYLVTSLEARNVHVPMVPMEFTALQVSRRNADGDPYSLPVVWAENPPTIEVFKKQRRIWAGETLRREILLNVPPDEQVFLLEFRIVRKLSWYQRPFNLLLNVPSLKRFGPKRRSWYVESIVEGCSKPEARNERNHSSGRGSNGRRNEEMEESDRRDEE